MPHLRASVVFCLLPIGAAAPAQERCATEIAKILAFDGQEFDQFGGSVALSGDTAIVGALYSDGIEDLSGAAYVFDQVGGVWTEGPKLMASDGTFLDEFGGRVAISGNTAVIGAAGADGPNSACGAAYVFEKIGGNWIETAKLSPLDGESFDAFGSSVAVSGGTVVVGSLYGNGMTANSGAAYVFEKNHGSWIQVAKLIALDGTTMDEFGVSVATDAQTVVVGAWRSDAIGTDAGAAYVFGNAGGVWIPAAALTASNGAAFDRFGYSVALSGARAVVGAYLHDASAPASGSAYVFDNLDGIWSAVAELTAFDAAGSDRFGVSVAVQGDRVLIGANGNDGDGEDYGTAYVFDHSGGAWTPLGELMAGDAGSGHLFGTSVALDGDALLIGSIFDPQLGEAAGSAYLFDATELVVITQQPLGVRVELNNTATFTAAASGNVPLSFQWQKDETDLADGGNISGSATLALMIDSVETSDSGSYRLVVFSPLCSISSRPATLNVVGAPGDLDVDGEVDLDDVSVFLTCLTGTTGGIAEGCAEADFDRDGNVDLADFTEFQKVFSPPRPTGDFDGDGDVDLYDFDSFFVCLTGPGIGIAPACGPADLEEDDDVDLFDFAVFTAAFAPPPPLPGDFDGDGDVDLYDLTDFTGCMTGPDGEILPGCAPGDFDGDDDIDLADFADFAVAFAPPPPIPGDLDGDGDVDLDDFNLLADCITGPGGGMLFQCEYADLDADGDVDALDFAAFQELFTTP